MRREPGTPSSSDYKHMSVWTLVSGPKGMYETCLTLSQRMVDINMKSC